MRVFPSVAVMAVCVGLSAGAIIAPAAAAEEASGVSSVAPSRSNHALSFWTTERMHSAVAGGETASDIGREEITDKRDIVGAEWEKGGVIAKTTGRLFFLVDEGAIEPVPSSCSAGVVRSANESVVMTADHCAQGSDYVFVPGYRDGDAPYGMWLVDRIFHPSAPNLAEDFAAFVLNRLDGLTIESVVGAQEIRFMSDRPDRLAIFGYPRERINAPEDPWGGNRLIYSEGATHDRPFGTIGTGSDMGRGASGGPLLADFDETTGRGVQVAVVSSSPCLAIDDDGNCTEQEYSLNGNLFNRLAQKLYTVAARHQTGVAND